MFRISKHLFVPEIQDFAYKLSPKELRNSQILYKIPNMTRDKIL